MINPLQQQLTPSPIYAIWTGQSLTRYKFEIHPVGTQFNPVPGVYLFCKRVTMNSFLALYVGETDNLSRRVTSELGRHHCWPSAYRAGAIHIGALVVRGYPSYRINIETDLRHGLRPALNKQ